MKIFRPLTTYSSPSRVARVEMPATSLPAPGSVMPSAPIFVPAIAGASHHRFCSSVPNLRIGGVTYSHCTLTAMLTPPLPHRAISSARTSIVR